MEPKFKYGDRVEAFFCDGGRVKGKITAVHILKVRVKYDIDVDLGNGCYSRIHNVDGGFVFAEGELKTDKPAVRLSNLLHDFLNQTQVPWRSFTKEEIEELWKKYVDTVEVFR